MPGEYCFNEDEVRDMINAVIGDVVFTNGQTLVLRAYGVEYSFQVSSQTAMRISQLESSQRSGVRILAYLQHREDEMCLFGFYGEEERQLFMELIKVSGIGPKQALKILSGASVHDFLVALDQNDIKFLSRIPGLGVKTSQKILLAMRDKLVDLGPGGAYSAAAGTTKRYNDLIAALAEMGYDKKQVADVICDLEKSNSESLGKMSLHEQEEFLFRKALGAL